MKEVRRQDKEKQHRLLGCHDSVGIVHVHNIPGFQSSICVRFQWSCIQLPAYPIHPHPMHTVSMAVPFPVLKATTSPPPTRQLSQPTPSFSPHSHYCISKPTTPLLHPLHPSLHCQGSAPYPLAHRVKQTGVMRT